MAHEPNPVYHLEFDYNTAIPTSVSPIVCGYFRATMAKLRNCHTDHLADKA